MKFSKIATALLCICCFASAAHSAEPRNPSGFLVTRGINISHWLSQDFGWTPREAFFTEQDVAYIASLGFDHIRLPIDEKELWSENGEPIEEAFSLLDKAIGWCRERNLRVIVDLHTVRSHHFNAANEGLTNTLWTDPAAQESFLQLWADISERIGHHPVDWVAYEIMNEPVADEHDDWNQLIAFSLRKIREREPNRVVVIGSNLWQMPHTLPFLEVPEDDKNIILSTHSYSPLIFTHYKADWTPLQVYEGGVQYPGRPISAEALESLLQKSSGNMEDLLSNAGEVWDRKRIAAELKPAIEHAKALGLQLYCGEFGCLPTVPREDRLRYYRDFVQVLEDNGVAWANWEYKGDFGIFEWHREIVTAGAPDVELIDVLLAGKDRDN